MTYHRIAYRMTDQELDKWESMPREHRNRIVLICANEDTKADNDETRLLRLKQAIKELT